MRKYLKFIVYLALLTAFSGARADSYVDFFRAINLDLADEVQALLAAGFDPNTLSESGQTPLYLALRDESPKVTAVLLASPELKPDLANAAGETALMMAALRGQLDAVRRLVALGARIQRSGWTPLHYAASGPSTPVVAYLLDQGAAIDAVSPNGSTAVMMAARYGPEPTVELLVARGADKKLRDKLNRTAFDLAGIAEREYLLPILR